MKWVNIFEKSNLKGGDFYINKMFYNQQTSNLILIGKKNDRPWVGYYDLNNDKFIFHKYLSTKNFKTLDSFKAKEGLIIVLEPINETGSLVIKMSKSGEIVWKRFYKEKITCFVDEDNVATLIGNDISGKISILTVEQSNGKVINQKTLDRNIEVRSIFKTKDRYILVGNTSDEIWITTISDNLEMLSEKTFGGKNYVCKALDAIRILSGYDLVIVGYIQKEQYGCCIKPGYETAIGLILKTTYDGKIIWSKITKAVSVFTKVIEADWGYVATGFKEFSHDTVHPVLCKLNPYGELDFVKRYNINNYALAFDVEYVARLSYSYVIAGLVKFDYVFEEQGEEYETWVYRPFLLKTDRYGETLTHTVKSNFDDFEFAPTL